MAYRLPEEIRYHEKIVFGLNWKQVVKITFYTVLALPLLKNSFLPRLLRISASLAVITLGGLVTVTGWDKRIYSFLKYAATFDEAGYLDENAYSFTGIDDVYDNRIVKTDGTELAIIRVKPLNLRVKSGDQRKRILENYKKFLDSLDFPIVVHVRRVKTINSVRNYFNAFEERVERNAEEQGNNRLKVFAKKHRDFFEEYMHENSSKKRLYYIVLPVSGQDTGNGELERRVKLVRENLMPVGLETTRLNTQELVSFVASFFEEFVEKDQDYLFPLTMHKKSEEENRRSAAEEERFSG